MEGLTLTADTEKTLRSQDSEPPLSPGLTTENSQGKKQRISTFAAMSLKYYSQPKRRLCDDVVLRHCLFVLPRDAKAL